MLKGSMADLYQSRYGQETDEVLEYFYQLFCPDQHFAIVVFIHDSPDIRRNPPVGGRCLLHSLLLYTFPAYYSSGNPPKKLFPAEPRPLFSSRRK